MSLPTSQTVKLFILNEIKTKTTKAISFPKQQWSSLVTVVQQVDLLGPAGFKLLFKPHEHKELILVVISVPTSTDSDIPQPRPWVRPVFLPVSIHLSGTWTPWLYHEHTPDHPANAWIHGFILHNCNGLCEMTWVVRGCGARLSWPKCFLFFLLYFMCVYPGRSVLC